MNPPERPERLRTPGPIDPPTDHYEDHKTIAELVNEYDRRLHNLEIIVLFVFVWLGVLTIILSLIFGWWVAA